MGVARGTGVRDRDKQLRKNTCLCVRMGVRENREVCRWSSVGMSVRGSWEGRLGPSREGPRISAWRVSTYPQWGWCIGTDTLLAGSPPWRAWRNGKQGD